MVKKFFFKLLFIIIFIEYNIKSIFVSTYGQLNTFDFSTVLE